MRAALLLLSGKGVSYYQLFRSFKAVMCPK